MKLPRTGLLFLFDVVVTVVVALLFLNSIGHLVTPDVFLFLHRDTIYPCLCVCICVVSVSVYLSKFLSVCLTIYLSVFISL